MQPSSLNKRQLERWADICSYLNHWYYRPDTEALAVALSVYASHFNLTQKAVWLFVIGPSGTGKTEIICNALKALPSTLEKSDITSTTLISGLKKAVGGSSLLLDELEKIGKGPETHGVLVFKDFTSIMSRRPEIRAEIMAQLREIWDGSYHPGKGIKVVKWDGKLTVVAAVTPAIERAWAVQRELGERFVQIRWPREDGVEMARSAARQVNQPNIVKDFQLKVTAFVDQGKLKPPEEEPDWEQFVHLAEAAAILRGHVVRDTGGSREIIDTPQPEAPTRLIRAMVQVAAGHASLFRLPRAGADGIRLARRIALDSIPLSRLRVLRGIEQSPHLADLVAWTGLSDKTLGWITDEMQALGIVEKSDFRVDMTKRFGGLWAAASDGLPNVVRFPTGVAAEADGKRQLPS